MRIEALLCALVMFAELSGSARADLVLHPANPPQFNSADRHTIARNDLLRAIVRNDPWLVRRMLDLMEEFRKAGSADLPDAAKNPDLALAGRTAEGSVEWLELLKRARAEKEERDRLTANGAARSAQGSVEMIEMMRRARAAKEAGQ